MADGNLVLQPQPAPEISGHDGTAFDNLGDPLPQRPADIENSEIIIDARPDLYLAISNDKGFAAPAIRENREPPPFGENLARDLPENTLNQIANETIQGVDADILSRQQWIDNYNKGIDLLGLKIEDLLGQGQRRNISRAGHPLMIEAMVKYQAGAEAEMLPAMGPVKVPTIGRVQDGEQALADAFQDDFNYFLTEIATEYYPDTQRMLMHQAFCGIGYKKIYRCPIRRRPVSESVLATDLIVSEEATDVDNALRVTHSIQMLKSQLRRMQIAGHYLDINLGAPGVMMGIGQSANRKIKESEGLTIVGFGRPQDQPYEILECDETIDIDEYPIDGYYERRTPDGLPLPYKVAVERNSQRVLGIWRNWRPDDTQMCLKRNMYVKFGLVPGLGYHDWGFLQLLGNQTRALRAILRLLIDAGMFSNFPGGMKNSRARTATNEISPGPGEFVDIDNIGANEDLRAMVVPLPYKGPDSVFIQLSEIIKQDAMRLGGTVMLEVGEGRTNVPVGTVMAMIVQQVQVMAQVFKRNHRAQRDELRKLRELFADNPGDLSMLCRDRPRSPEIQMKVWEKAEEFMDLNLQPASDPNVPSTVHRMMATNVLAMMAQQMPAYFDVPEVIKDVITTIGKDPERFQARPENQPEQQPDPKIVAAQATAAGKLQVAQMESTIEMAKINSEQQQAGLKAQVEREQMAADTASDAAQNETRRQTEHIKSATDIAKIHHQAAVTPAPVAPSQGNGIGGGTPHVTGFAGQPMPIP